MTITDPVVASPRRPRPRRPIALRVGLVLAALLGVLNAIPAVSDIGLNGTAWDIVVVFLAVFAPGVAIATLLLLPFAWNGRRRPATAIAVLQLVAIVGLLPPFVLVFTDGLPLVAPLSAGITILLEVLSAWLISRGMQGRVVGPSPSGVSEPGRSASPTPEPR